MTLIDKGGVPKIVQRLRYVYSAMAFEIRLFDGRVAVLGAEDLSPTVTLCQLHPDHAQMQDAWIEAERIFTEHATDRAAYISQRAMPEFYL